MADDTYLLDQATGSRVLLRGATVLVGRGAETQVRIDDDLLSRRHFALTQSPDGWVIRDLGSTNGTTVNGEKLRAGQARPLRAGDCVQAGRGQWTLQRATHTPRVALSVPVHGKDSVSAPRAPVVAPGIAPWQWLASAFLALGAILTVISLSRPWFEVQFRLAVENLPAGDLLAEGMDAVKSLFGIQTSIPLIEKPEVFPISGLQLRGELLLVPVALILIVLLLDLRLKLSRSCLPGIGYLGVVGAPAVMLLLEYRSVMQTLTDPVFLGISLMDVVRKAQAAAPPVLDIHPVPAIGLYLAGLGLLLLLIGGFVRLVAPLAQSQR